MSNPNGQSGGGSVLAHGSMHKIDELAARCSCADEVIE